MVFTPLVIGIVLVGMLVVYAALMYTLMSTAYRDKVEPSSSAEPVEEKAEPAVQPSSPHS